MKSVASNRNSSLIVLFLKMEKGLFWLNTFLFYLKAIVHSDFI